MDQGVTFATLGAKYLPYIRFCLCVRARFVFAFVLGVAWVGLWFAVGDGFCFVFVYFDLAV